MRNPAKRSTVAALFVLALLLAPALVLAEPVAITIENATDAAILELHLATPDSDEWSEVALDVEAIEPGESLVVTIMDGEEDCLYDFLVVFDDDTELEVLDAEVCDGEAYAITSE
jgi:hypothetical protein